MSENDSNNQVVTRPTSSVTPKTADSKKVFPKGSRGTGNSNPDERQDRATSRPDPSVKPNAAGLGIKPNSISGHRGVPTPVSYVFDITITPAMEKADDNMARHLLAIRLIFPQEERKKLQDIVNKRHLSGFKAKFKQTDLGKTITYTIPKSIYNMFPYPKLQPKRSIGVDYKIEKILLEVLREYDEALQTLQKDKERIIELKLKNIVKSLKIYKFNNSNNIRVLRDLMIEVTMKLNALDNEAMINLRDGDSVNFRDRTYIFTPVKAIEDLGLFSKKLDMYVKKTQSRVEKHTAINLNFKSSKDKLQELEEGYRKYHSIEEKKSELEICRAHARYNYDDGLGKRIPSLRNIDDPTTGKKEEEIKQLTNELENYLARNTIKSIKDFEALIDSFINNFKKATHQLVLAILSKQIRLLDSEFRQRKLEPEYFKNLYTVLNDLQNNKSAEKHFPIIQYSQYDVFSLQAEIASDKSISKTNKEGVFSSILTRDIADILLNQKEAWKILNDKKKGSSLIWDLDALLQRAYLEFEMEGNSIHRQIIRTYLSKKARENLFGTLIWTAVILALSVIPGVGWVGLGAAAVVTGKGLHDLYFDIKDNEIGEIMKKAGLRSEMPSDWWIFISVVGVFGDMKAFTNIAKKIAGSEYKFLNQIEEARKAGKLDQELSLEKYSDLEDIAKKLLVRNSVIKDDLKRIKKDLVQAWNNALKATGSLGAGSFDEELVIQLSKVAYHLIEMGYKTSDIFIMEVRIFLKKKLTVDNKLQLDEIFDAAKNKQRKAGKILAAGAKVELTPESRKWLIDIGESAEKIERQLLHHKTSSDIIEAINAFGGQKNALGEEILNNFDQVVKSWFAKGNQQKGARFVMRFSLNLLKYHKVDDIVFEVASTKKIIKGTRIIDIMVPGIRYELKSVKEVRASLALWSKSRQVASQFEKDLELWIAQEGILSPNNSLKWIFDKASLPAGYEKKEVVSRIRELLDEGIFRNHPQLQDIKILIDDIVDVWEISGRK